MPYIHEYMPPTRCPHHWLWWLCVPVITWCGCSCRLLLLPLLFLHVSWLFNTIHYYAYAHLFKVQFLLFIFFAEAIIVVVFILCIVRLCCMALALLPLWKMKSCKHACIEKTSEQTDGQLKQFVFKITSDLITRCPSAPQTMAKAKQRHQR